MAFILSMLGGFMETPCIAEGSSALTAIQALELRFHALYKLGTSVLQPL